jgi:hypothetical protein
MRLEVLGLSLLAALAFGAVAPGVPTRGMEIKMPNSHPKHPETYFCTPVRLDPNNTNYIVGFKPKVNTSNVGFCQKETSTFISN